MDAGINSAASASASSGVCLYFTVSRLPAAAWAPGFAADLGAELAAAGFLGADAAGGTAAAGAGFLGWVGKISTGRKER